MRRWILLLLIFMLPLQSVRAAAGVCVCIDEGNRSALAASAQAHLDALAQVAAAPDDGAGGDRRDVGEDCSAFCTACHLGCAQMLQPDAFAFGAPPPHRPLQQDLTPLQDHIPDGLERPDWQHRA